MNNSKKYQFTTGLEMKDQVLEIVDEAKLLTLSLKQGVDFFFVMSKRTIEKGSWVNL